MAFGYALGVSAENETVFSTWEGLEADKCASIWLIKRFISPDAKIYFSPRNSEIDGGILFDIPGAKLSRRYNKSTFETLLENYKVNDSGAIYIGKIIHDVEVNMWGEKLFSETEKVKSDIAEGLSQESNNPTVYCINYFDQFHLRVEK